VAAAFSRSSKPPLSGESCCAAIPDPMSPATLDEHEADTFGEHVFMNLLSPWSSFGGAVMVRLAPQVELLRRDLGDRSPRRGLVDNRL
jgi:hypothetical protein